MHERWVLVAFDELNEGQRTQVHTFLAVAHKGLLCFPGFTFSDLVSLWPGIRMAIKILRDVGWDEFAIARGRLVRGAPRYWRGVMRAGRPVRCHLSVWRASVGVKVPRRRGIPMRRAVAVVLAAATMTLTAVGFASSAQACDNTNHCYGIAAYSRSGVKGVHATIAPYYLTSPSGTFTTDEIWLVSSNGAYWVEAGYIRNFANINGVSQGLTTFWFDSRPGGGTHGHVLQTNPALTARTFYVMQSSPTTSYAVGDGTATGYSTSNTMTPYISDVGSETTTSSSCSRAHDYSMSYSIGSGWVGFPSAGTSVNSPQRLTWVKYPTNMEAGVWC